MPPSCAGLGQPLRGCPHAPTRTRLRRRASDHQKEVPTTLYPNLTALGRFAGRHRGNLVAAIGGAFVTATGETLLTVDNCPRRPPASCQDRVHTGAQRAGETAAIDRNQQ